MTIIIKISPVWGLTVDSSQLTFVPTSKSRETNQDKYQKSEIIKFTYCA